MKILDVYIIKKFLSTFLMMFLLFIPIGILVDISEKIDKFRENEVPGDLIFKYYIDFQRSANALWGEPSISPVVVSLKGMCPFNSCTFR